MSTTTPTITREQFQAAIHRGLAAATEIPTSARTELMRLADSAKRIGFGAYNGVVTCPIARIYPKTWGNLTWDGPFVQAYDDAIREAVGEGHEGAELVVVR